LGAGKNFLISPGGGFFKPHWVGGGGGEGDREIRD